MVVVAEGAGERRSMCRELFEFLETLYRAPSAEGATLIFGRFLERNGFDAFSCGEFDTQSLGQSRYFAKSWPGDYGDLYYGRAGVNPDPVRKLIPSRVIGMSAAPTARGYVDKTLDG
jgi:hypothetical protein